MNFNDIIVITPEDECQPLMMPVQFSYLLTLRCIVYQYNKYKRHARTDRLAGECGMSLQMISTSYPPLSRSCLIFKLK